MRYLVTLAFLLLGQIGLAQDWEDRRVFNAGASGATLQIVSSTDTDLFAPLIDAFVAKNPDVSVVYLVTGTAELDRRFRAAPEAFDIVISSAMDLQLKLANDGLALHLGQVSHLATAVWRQSLFGFTTEPAAIVINRAAFEGAQIPQSRQDLIEALRAQPEKFRAKVGTYDVRQSGLGYLFATQDARASETFWRLMEVMGGLDVRLYCCSGEMIDDLLAGRIAVAYNVLGSYAAARIESPDALEIVLPSDFPTTMMRTAFVSKDTRSPNAAEAFIRHLVALQSGPSAQARLLPGLNVRQGGAERAVIALDTALLTFLDTLKRKKFLSEWESAVIQN